MRKGWAFARLFEIEWQDRVPQRLSADKQKAVRQNGLDLLVVEEGFEFVSRILPSRDAIAALRLEKPTGLFNSRGVQIRVTL